MQLRSWSLPRGRYGRLGRPEPGRRTLALRSDAIWMLVSYLQSLPVPAGVPTQSWKKP